MDDERIIDAKKEYSKLHNKSVRDAKKSRCLFCGREVSSFCNSHSVPQFVLKNIGKNGYVNWMNSMFSIPLVNDSLGVNQAGTFHLLCKDCDKKVFSDYETPNAIINYPTNVMINEIALKDILVRLGKRYYELELFNNMSETYNAIYPYEYKQSVNSIDLRDYEIQFERNMDMIKGSNQSKYHIMFWHKLAYIVPIAYQGTITMYGDLEGGIINDIYDQSEEVVMQDLHIAVLPVEKESIVMMFYHEDDFRYSKFEEQFNTLSLNQKLNLINYLIFYYSEDMFISKKLSKNILADIAQVSSLLTEFLAFSQEEVEEIKKEKQKALVDSINIPNLLLEKYKL